MIVEDATMEISPGERVKVWTFNGTVPGPTLRFTEDDNITIHFINKAPMVHTLHLHGTHDSKNDGTFPLILPNQTYDYNFIADLLVQCYIIVILYQHYFISKWECMVH
jgi:FtsP/CotA-like multicopper oxidase with cupredoxin domain